MILTFRMFAGEHERFTEEAALGLIGQSTTLEMNGEMNVCLVVGAELEEDPQWILVTVRAPDHIIPEIDDGA